MESNGNETLETVDSHNVLGVTLQSNLKWDLHVSEIVDKASKRLHILRVLKRGGVPPPTCCGFTPLLSVLSLSTAVRYGIPPSLSTCLLEWRRYRSVHAIRFIYPVVLRYHEVLVTSGYTELRIRRDEY